MTEQTVQIKMENQKEAGLPDSPGQEWRLDRAAGQRGGVRGECSLKGSPTPRGGGPAWTESQVEKNGAGGRRQEGAAWRTVGHPSNGEGQTALMRAGTPRRVPSGNFTPAVPGEP